MAVTAVWYELGVASFLGFSANEGMAWNTTDASVKPFAGLVRATYTPNQLADQYWDSAPGHPGAAEVSAGTGYVPYGTALNWKTPTNTVPTNPTLDHSVARTVALKAEILTFAESSDGETTIDALDYDAKYLILYMRRASSMPLIGWITFAGTGINPDNAEVVITWNTNGILEIVADAPA